MCFRFPVKNILSVTRRENPSSSLVKGMRGWAPAVTAPPHPVDSLGAININASTSRTREQTSLNIPDYAGMKKTKETLFLAFSSEFVLPVVLALSLEIGFERASKRTWSKTPVKESELTPGLQLPRLHVNEQTDAQGR